VPKYCDCNNSGKYFQRIMSIVMPKCIVQACGEAGKNLGSSFFPFFLMVHVFRKIASFYKVQCEHNIKRGELCLRQ